MAFLSKKPCKSFCLALKQKLGLNFRIKVCPTASEGPMPKVRNDFSCLDIQQRFQFETSCPLTPCIDKNYIHFLQSVDYYIQYCHCRSPNLGHFQMFKEIVSCYFSPMSPYQVAVPTETKQTLMELAMDFETFSKLLPTRLQRLHAFDECVEYIKFCRREALARSDHDSRLVS